MIFDAFFDSCSRVPALRQRAKCRECKRTFILEPKGPCYPAEFKEQVLRAYEDRMSLAAIGRTFGVCCQTVMAWAGGKI